MRPAELKTRIKTAFKTQRLFIKAFNASGGTLDEITLSRQLKGAIEISAGWRSAYEIFFRHSPYFLKE